MGGRAERCGCCSHRGLAQSGRGQLRDLSVTKRRKGNKMTKVIAINQSATGKAGTYKDKNGKFTVFWNDDPSAPGWYWDCSEEGGDEQGPFETSEAAYQSAKNLDFSYNK